MNHLKTFPGPPVLPMYARRANTLQVIIAGRGKPRRVVWLKRDGALRERERPYKAREEVYRSEDAADHAEVRSALMGEVKDDTRSNVG